MTKANKVPNQTEDDCQRAVIHLRAVEASLSLGSIRRRNHGQTRLQTPEQAFGIGDRSPAGRVELRAKVR